MGKRKNAGGARARISRIPRRTQRRASFAVCALIVGTAGLQTAAGAQSPPAPTGAPLPPPPAPTPFATTGAWSFTGVANIDLMRNVDGGIRDATEGLSKFALAAAYDGSQDDHDGLSGLISAQFVHGGKLSGNAIGDVQGADNIEAIGALRLYEAWLSRDYDGARGWKAGLIDLNVDFDTNDTGALFLNSSDGIGPELGHSGLNGPAIYPTTALGLTGYQRVGAGLTIRAGLFDGTAGSPYHPKDLAIRLSNTDGVLAIVQVEQRFDSGLRLEGGAWAYSAHFEALARFDPQGNTLRYQRGRGAYALIEAPIFKAGGDGERGLSGWARVGIADPVIQQISGYIGGGVVYTGLFASRPEDQTGVAVNHAIVGVPDILGGEIVGLRKSAETDIEFSYRYDATDWLAVQPDTQLIIHPAGTYRTAYVVGVRFSITLTKSLEAKIKDVAN